MYSWNVDHDAEIVQSQFQCMRLHHKSAAKWFSDDLQCNMCCRCNFCTHTISQRNCLLCSSSHHGQSGISLVWKNLQSPNVAMALWNGKLFKHFCNIFRGKKGRFSNSFLCWLTATNTRRHLFDITAEFYAHGMKKTRVTVARMKWTEKSIRFHFCIPFSSLSVFALTATAFRWTDRWIRWGKNCGKKNKSHIALCSVCTRRRNTNCTNRAFNWNTTSPTWGSFCRCPHASPRRLQCGTLSRSQKNSLSREDL